MSFKPLPPLRGMSGAGMDVSDDSASINTTSTTKSLSKNPVKKMWCETQWVNLSLQAKNIGLAKLPYFDPDTMILSKEVNNSMWKQLNQLYNHLGEKQAPYATPQLHDAGPKKPPELRWYSFLDEQKGAEAEVYDR